MAIIIVNGMDTTKLSSDVNALLAAGYVPACGLTYRNGVFYQPMVTGDSAVAYSVIDEATDVAFQSKANVNAGRALGEMLTINGRFIQAYGDGVSDTSSAAFNNAVLAIVNGATVGDEDYAGLTTYVLAIINSTGALAEDDPTIAGLRLFIQKVIDAQP